MHVLFRYNVIEPTDSNVPQYDSSEPISSYEEIRSYPPNEHDPSEQNVYEEVDKEEHNESDDSYEIPHEYTDVL